ncbi:MAG: protein translocase subunit SecF [Thermodesulfovibrionales bacterium]|nr:protein translocase subunit SecF [Thermodesulfovibrionales bacterium]
MIELLKKTNIDFMGKKMYAFAFSAALSSLGIMAIIQIGRGAANMGIDFVGGTSVQVKFAHQVSLNDMRGALEEAGIKDFDLQDMPSANKLLITAKRHGEATGLADGIIAAIKKKFPEKNPVVDSITEIGPKVGKRLRNDALIAILAATIGILLYVAFRFQFRFAVGATIATFHDVLAVLGVFYLMGKEINLVIVSALLMVAGYSLTDTVVVFDRIRENLRKRLKEPTNETINRSINEVLSRTIIVSLTVLFTAVALFVFGGEVIHDFSLAIIMGIVVGTFSSVFIASPAVLLLGGKKPFAVKK